MGNHRSRAVKTRVMPRQDDELVIVKKALKADFSKMEELDEGDVDDILKGKGVNMFDVTHTVEHSVGEVLTVIDGCITDKEQKKAIKSMIKNSMYDILDTLHALSESE